MSRLGCLGKLSLLLIVSLLLSPLYLLILLVSFRWRTRIGPALLRYYAKIVLAILRVRIAEVGGENIALAPGTQKLVVANHVSSLDIFVLSSLFGSTFVSKDEVRYYPIIGWIAALMGTIFLDRDSPRARYSLIRTIAKHCTDRIVVVFPQGTTSRIGDRLPFFRGIFKVIELNPDIVILPVTLRYREEANIAWHKPQSLVSNILAVCAQARVHVSVVHHRPIGIDDYRGKTAADVCTIVEQMVLSDLVAESAPTRP